MSSRVIEIFEDQNLVVKIQSRLPRLFQMAELESSRAGKIGMQVGSVRENIIVALFVYKFGEENIDTEVPITEPEVDVLIYGEPISIKTITGSSFSGVKLIWTVDTQKAREFRESYNPHCDMVLIQINWGNGGGFYYIPLEVQTRHFKHISRKNYIKLPKPGTNPRGVEIAKEALLTLIEDKEVRNIPINWQKTTIDFNPYKRWVEFWREE